MKEVVIKICIAVAGCIIGFIVSYYSVHDSANEIIDYEKQRLKKDNEIKDSIIRAERKIKQDLAIQVDEIQADRDSAKAETAELIDRVNYLKYRYENKKYDFSGGVSSDSILNAFATELSN